MTPLAANSTKTSQKRHLTKNCTLGTEQITDNSKNAITKQTVWLLAQLLIIHLKSVHLMEDLENIFGVKFKEQSLPCKKNLITITHFPDGKS